MRFCSDVLKVVCLFLSFLCILLGVYTHVHVGMEYVKVLLKDGCMIGAILVGETGLEVVYSFIHTYTHIYDPASKFIVIMCLVTWSSLPIDT